MEKRMFDFAVRNARCLPNGFKEACFIAKEGLGTIEMSEPNINGIDTSANSVTIKEFKKALSILIAYAWQNRANDCVPEEVWQCDVDCTHIGTSIFCPGEFQIAGKDDKGEPLSKRLCPHFRDSGNI